MLQAVLSVYSRLFRRVISSDWRTLPFEHQNVDLNISLNTLDARVSACSDESVTVNFRRSQNAWLSSGAQFEAANAESRATR